MHLMEEDLQQNLPISALSADQDVIVPVDVLDGEEYDDLVDMIVKHSESSRSIGSFVSVNFDKVVRIHSHGNRGMKCYEGYAKDTKGRIWFLKILPEFRAYDVGMEAEDHLAKFIDQYTNISV